MHIRSHTRLLFAPALAAVALLGACGDDDGDDAGDAVEDVAQDVGDAVGEAGADTGEAIARNLAAQQGEDEFEAAGIDVEDELACEATMTDDSSAVEISCTGVAEDGRELALQGTTSEVPGASVTELEGDFVGTADGEQVFAVDTLGG